MKEILLYSSGLDSLFAREYLLSQGKDLECIYFDLKNKYSKQEIETIKNTNDSVSIHYDFINLKQCEHADAFMPNRNFLLVMLTQSIYYNCNKIWIGGSKSDRVNDNSKEVFDELSIFLSKVHKRNIEISSPFWNVYKTDVIEWFMKYRLPKPLIADKDENKINNVYQELLDNTFSCYTPNEHKLERLAITTFNETLGYKTYECLNCSACFRKNVELYHIGLFRDFSNISLMNKYQNEFHKAIESTPRSKATLEYIERLKRI